jgi:hypothetical protein
MLLVQRFLGERVALLRHRVGGRLELVEEDLSDEGPRDVVRVEVGRQYQVGFRPLEHVVEEERFARDGRDLRNEGRVVRVLERLVLGGQVGVDRVPHLVDERENVLKRPAPVEQKVGVRVVAAPRVGAAPLPLARVYVDPSLVVRLLPDRGVLLAERLLPEVEGHRVALFEGDLLVELRRARRTCRKRGVVTPGSLAEEA